MNEERHCRKCLNIHAENIPCPDMRKVRRLLLEMGIGAKKGNRRERRAEAMKLKKKR